MRYGKSGVQQIDPSARRRAGQSLKKAAPGAPFGWCGDGTPYIGTQYGIKAANGQLACVLELPESATLASVHAALLARSIVGAGTKYELRTAFPSKSLTEPSRTLAALGLAPSATLCVRHT